MENKKKPFGKFRFILLLVIFLSLLFSIYFVYYKFWEVKEESLISSDFFIIFQTKNIFSLFNQLDESNLFDAIFYTKEMKDVYKTLIDIRFQMPKSRQRLFNIVNSPATMLVDQDKQSILIFNTGLKTPLFNVTSMAVKKILADSEDIHF
ncbi:MAG: hypothetical protein JW827_08445, partial [Spirochaetes bacterium]|nr:hypothetical protein [Spirochaetota bacterium]